MSTSALPPELQAHLSALAAEAPAERTALLDDAPTSAALPQGKGRRVIKQVADIAEQFQPPRAALALLSPSWMQRAAEAGHLERDLAALRDLYAEAIVAIVDQDCPLSPPRWRALGFRPWQHDAECDMTLQGFNLYDYKQRPDWLNAKHWANPELWDVYRW